MADDPRRFVSLRSSAGKKLHELLSAQEWHALSPLRFRRPVASWIRLFLALTCCGRPALDFDCTLGFPGEGPFPFLHLLSCSSHSCLVEPAVDFFCTSGPVVKGLLLFPCRLLCSSHSCAVKPTCGACHLAFASCASSHSFGLVVELLFSFSHAPLCAHSRPRFAVEQPFLSFQAAYLHRPFLDFDSTLGFPGEGWFLFSVCPLALACAMATIAPSTPAEHGRAKRREPVLLVADRVVRPVTRSNRAKLLEAFGSWLVENHATSVSAVLAASGDIAERVTGLLVGYGQALFRGGHPYYKYSETINAVASAKPSIRRGLSYAWDLAFAWLTEEPTTLSSQSYACWSSTRSFSVCFGMGMGR